MKMEDYKGYEIHVNEKGIFEARQENKPIFTADKLQKLKEKINETEKQRVSIPAISYNTWIRGEPDFHNVTISTIVQEKGGYSGSYFSAWVTWKDSKGNSNREKKPLHQLLKSTDENKKLVEEITILGKQHRELEQKIEALKEKLVHFQPEDFGYKKE
jgi:hypothetical protein